jgi:TonB-dependent receptor
MMELPLSSMFSVNGGVRFEKTEMSIEFDAEKDVSWTDDDGFGHNFQADPPPNVPIDQTDVLPALGLEIRPQDTVTFRANYSQTVARPTFKEYAPIQYYEYLGGDLFVGNAALAMSSIDNYDLRLDWAAYPGGLVSVSWFYKNIENPIEYTQRSSDSAGVYTTAVNYPEGTMNGFEFEIRQQMGHYFDLFEGLDLGANFTLLDSEVQVSEVERERQEDVFPQYVEYSRPMLGAPAYLYNLNATYDLAKTGTRFGIFYVVKGDTLLAGASYYGNFIPSVYAKEFGTLNFTVTQQLGKHLSLSFKAKNLTNPDIQTAYKSDYTPETVKASYSTGREYSIGVSATW